MRRDGRPAWRGGGATTVHGPSRGAGFARMGAMGAIALAILLGAWLVIGRACASSCDGGYCPTSLDVNPPQGFSFASEIYEFRGEQPVLPDGGSVEIDIPISGEITTSGGLSFYRYLPETSAWEVAGPATLDESGSRAIGSFDSVPETIVLMRRNLPAGHVAVYIEPWKQLHPEAAARATMFYTRDFSPAGDGSLRGELTPMQLSEGQEHYPVIAANQGIDASLANLDAILATSGSRSSHVRQIVEMVTTNDVAGVNIAYTDLREHQRTSFALLIEELGVELRRVGRGLAVTAPAPTRTTERVEPGHFDWAVIGQSADFINIEPIRDQSTYRRDLPQILNYLREQVDRRKLLLTVTPYAAERSEEVRALTLVDAMRIASRIQVGDSDPSTNDNLQLRGANIDQTEGLSGILWDESTATVAFTYRNEGGRTVWIENVFSVSFKLEFVSAYGLGGFAVEDASTDEMLGDIWPAVVSFVETGQPQLLRPNPEDLEPQWQVSGGTLEGGRGGVVRWTTPSEAGTYTVRLTLSDGSFRFESEMQVTVEARPQTGTNGD